jgi:hypothetical protein
MTGGWPGTAGFGDVNLQNGNKIQLEECFGSFLTTRRSQTEVESWRRGGGAMVTTAAVPAEFGGSLRVPTRGETGRDCELLGQEESVLSYLESKPRALPRCGDRGRGATVTPTTCDAEERMKPTNGPARQRDGGRRRFGPAVVRLRFGPAQE